MTGAVVLVIMLGAVGYVWLATVVAHHLRDRGRDYPESRDDR